ncbi:MAG: glycosyltransferase family 2 protein, partial [Chloroflexota bacterium]
LVKRSVIERIGVLDERFFAYFEETEWCARARRANFRVVYVPQARLWHKIHPTARASSRSYLYLMARNRLLYLHCSGASAGRIFLASLDLLRTACSWLLRPQHRGMRPCASALLRGVGHFMIGQFGPPPA